MRWPKWTQWQLQVLEVLRRAKRPLHPQEIAQGMDKPSDDSNIVTGPIKKLVKEGLVEKRGSARKTTYEAIVPTKGSGQD